ncbi:MAG: ACT domain-containing protein [bacterium]
MISKDDDEITIVTKESNVAAVDFSEETKWFKLFEIKPHMPFLTVGFIATITQAIADKGLNVLVVSTYSKDYILIKDEDSTKAIEALKGLGFQIKE